MSIERFQVSVLKDVEPQPSWPQMCNDPQLFLQEIAKRLFVKVDTSDLIENIIISPTIPLAKDRSKLWVKTSWPYGIGFIADGEYKMDYSFTGFPTKIPFLHKEISPIPAYVKQLGTILLKEYGMEKMETTEGAKNRMLWYIFEPEKISI